MTTFSGWARGKEKEQGTSHHSALVGNKRERDGNGLPIDMYTIYRHIIQLFKRFCGKPDISLFSLHFNFPCIIL